jgi:phosphohistidine phosphatase
VRGASIRLLILRHAKSSWADSYSDDWERPLNERGERDAPRVGLLIRQLSLLPDLIVTSDAVRAHATTQAVAEAAGYGGRIVLSPRLYHATPQTIIEVLQEVPDSARAALIVGHNPGLEELVAQLTGESVELPTATLVHLEVAVNEWRDLSLSRRADLKNVWRPRELSS